MQDGHGPGPTGTAGGNAPLIMDSSMETFAADVMEASMDVPIVVDFWAPWCEPCKTLTPMLERVVQAAQGAVRLVKVNIDENEELARQLRIQSVPTVFAFKDGQPVDGFAGALPESQIKTFIERVLGGEIGPSPIEQLIEHGVTALAAGDAATAAQAFGGALQEDPENPDAIGGLTKAYLALPDLDRAKQVIEMATPAIANHPEIAGARAALDLAEAATGDHGDIAALQSAIEKDPKDLQSRFDLADALIAKNDREGAVDQLLTIVEIDREWDDEAARKKLVTLFEAFGPTDEITLSARRRLSSILFS